MGRWLRVTSPLGILKYEQKGLEASILSFPEKRQAVNLQKRERRRREAARCAVVPKERSSEERMQQKQMFQNEREQ